MDPSNPFYQLAVRPFQQGPVSLATLLRTVEDWVAQPPFQPLPDPRVYTEVLDAMEGGPAQLPAPFQSYILLLTLLVAEIWARNHLLALFAAHTLWRTAEAHPLSAALIAALLPALERHPGYDRDPETHALVGGLRGLLALPAPTPPLTAETLDRLDQGLAFPRSGFVRRQLPWLLWDHRTDSALPTWEGLLGRWQREPEALRGALLATYPRAFFALRYGRMAKEQLDGGRLQALETIDEGARELLATPGLDTLDAADREALRAYAVRTQDGLLGGLQSCLHLLNRAQALLDPADAWPLTYGIQMAAAEARLRGFLATGDDTLLPAARALALRGAWATRRHNPLWFDHARHLLAKIERARRQPDRARRLWQGILRHPRRHAEGNDFAAVAATAYAQLAQLALERDDAPAARDAALAALAQVKDDLGGGSVAEPFSLDGWSATLLDTAIAACVGSGDGAKALELFERYSASALSRQLELPPLDPGALRPRLPRTTALVYLCLDPKGSSVLLVTDQADPAGLRLAFNWADLQIAIGPWLKGIWQLRSASPAQGLERLERFQRAMDRSLAGLTPLLRPLAQALQKRGLTRVVLMPGRGLGGLPLHAVPVVDGEGRRRDFGELFDVLYAPNARVWLAATAAQTARCQEQGFAGFATADAGFCAELIQAAAQWGSAEQPRLNATPAQFIQTAAESAVLHLSCHGWFQLAQGEEGRLVIDAGLHLGGGRLDWRTLLQQLRLPRARLVVLSACESLLLSHRDILNQQFGLPYAFLAAGAPLLLGSSWKVEATATTLLMTRFHENLRCEHRPASQALAEAQRWLRRLDRTQAGAVLGRYCAGQETSPWLPEGELPYRHPYWWAGFRLIGADLWDARA